MTHLACEKKSHVQSWRRTCIHAQETVAVGRAVVNYARVAAHQVQELNGSTVRNDLFI